MQRGIVKAKTSSVRGQGARNELRYLEWTLTGPSSAQPARLDWRVRESPKEASPVALACLRGLGSRQGRSGFPFPEHRCLAVRVSVPFLLWPPSCSVR
jgi:hypothetical protein